MNNAIDEMKGKVFVDLHLANGNVEQKELRFDTNAICNLEEATGKSFMRIMSMVSDSEVMENELSWSFITAAVWAGLLYRKTRKLKLLEVRSMIPIHFETMSDYGRQVIIAIAKGLGADKKSQEELEDVIDGNFTSDESSVAAVGPKSIEESV